MATVTGTIAFSGTVAACVGLKFVPEDTPQVLDGEVVIGHSPKIVTGEDGTFTADLAEGRYTVLVDNGEEFTIDVPTDGGDIANLVTSEPQVEADLYGNGSPEEVQTADPGMTYYDRTDQELWIKDTGNGNTGWRRHG